MELTFVELEIEVVRQGGMGFVTASVVLRGASAVSESTPTLATDTDKAASQNESLFIFDVGRDVMDVIVPLGAPCITETITFVNREKVSLLFDGIMLVIILRRDEAPEGVSGRGTWTVEAQDRSNDMTLTERVPVGPSLIVGSEVSFERADATLAMR